MNGQGIEWRSKHCLKFQPAEYRARTLQMTDDRQTTDDRRTGDSILANVNVNSRSPKVILLSSTLTFRRCHSW